MINQLLEMIEAVDPKDTAKLDEIDARVWCWLNDLDFIDKEMRCNMDYFLGTNNYDILVEAPEIQYTRSRDALKQIRPEGFKALINTEPTNGIFEVEQDLGSEESGNWHYGLVSSARAEILAELHAILQAIDFERKQNG